MVFGPAEGTFARLRWFDSIAYTVGGQRYTSNDMEHGVLRGNRPSPANVLSLLGLASLAPKTFKRGDARLPQARSHSSALVPLCEIDTESLRRPPLVVCRGGP